MTYTLRIGRRAAHDVERIHSWLANRSKQGAARWVTAFEIAAQRITQNPSEYGLPLDEESLSAELRQFLFKTRRGRIYRAVYCVVRDEVLILRVRGPGQPPLNDDELPLI